MMSARPDQSTSLGAIEGARLPERLEGWRVLEVGGDGSGGEHFAEMGAAFESCPEPTHGGSLDEGRFDLVHCSAELDSGLHPLSVYAWIWGLLRPDGVLLVGSRVLAEPAQSQYARFVPAGGTDARVSRWLPGRLALRWMVEVSGFEFDRWLDDADDALEGEVVAALQAVRVARQPALDLERQPLGG
jgi:SAM-dependent methyltransferase